MTPDVECRIEVFGSDDDELLRKAHEQAAAFFGPDHTYDLCNLNATPIMSMAGRLSYTLSGVAVGGSGRTETP